VNRDPFLPLLALASVLAAAPSVAGQSAHWDPPGGTLPVGQVWQLQLVFDDCTPNDTPTPPKVDGLRLDYEGQSSNISMINGSFSRNVTITFAALLAQQKEVDLPPFTVETNKGQLRVPAAHFSPTGSTVGSGGVSLGEAASARLVPSPETVWEGEVFELDYTIDVASGYYPNWGRGTFEWDSSPLVIEDWSQPAPFDSRAGTPRTCLAYRTRAIARTVGRLRLNPTSQLVNLSVGVTGFGFFQQRSYQQFAVPSSPATLEVRPLPPAPSGFAGAVGEFKVDSKVVPVHVKVGDPVTWTVELAGTGNWPEIRGIPARQAPASFQAIQPKPKRTQPQGKLFEGTLAEDVVLVPTQPGTYELPNLDFIYFDPKAAAYKTVSAPGATVIVDPAVAAPEAGGEAGTAAGGPPPIAVAATPEAKAPEPPAPNLGDPTPPSGDAPRPLLKRSLLAACAAPFAAVALLWIALALRRARATDPARPRREARRRLASTLGALRDAPSSGKPRLILAWQRDAAVIWAIDHAAPPPASVGDAEWRALWEEADRSLYSPDTMLPGDWVGRAHAALARKTLRPFSPARILLPSNLIPLLGLAVALAASSAAADPAEAYRRGDFAGAEKAWAEEAQAHPLDWSARHNLSLALSQEDRFGEAAAQAASSFVQQASDPSVRRQMVYACDKAGFVPEPLDVLLQPGPVQALARLESPGAWQRTGVAAAALAAAALALLLGGTYAGFRSAWLRAPALALLVGALMLGAASIAAYRAYGLTADSRAVIVWQAGLLRSIPTEADVSQKTSPLAAGSAAIADRTFLTWIRIVFPNGETGWIPRDEAVYVWGLPGPERP
jgi:hypothetical protein